MANVNSFLCVQVFSLGLLLSPGAVQALDSNSNSKVNNAMARRWSEDAKAGQQAKSGYELQQKEKVLNVNRGKNCNLNVGTKQPGQKGDVIVTTKEVINVCK